tara:strand:+ start:1877 stop:2650 length:774 start_codon:yes stop_codon:yes gene_type:complete
MIKENFILNKLKNNQTVIGTWCTIPSPIVTDIICSSNLDFVIIDMEHGPISFETAQEMIITSESRNVSPIIRVPSVNQNDSLRSLDIGAHGIQFPNIDSIDHINNIINYCCYPPKGNRGFSPFTRAGNYSIKNAQSLTEKSNKNILKVINIENKNIAENIDDFINQDIDVFFIGLYDMSKSFGIPGQINDKTFQEYIKKLNKKIINSGKITGTITTDMASLEYYKNIGMKYLVHLVDCEMLNNSYSQIVNYFKKINE